MRGDFPSIMPSNSSPLMRAMEQTLYRVQAKINEKNILGLDLSKIWDLDTYVERDGQGNPVYDEKGQPVPARHAALLPYLAAAHNIPVWRDEWNVLQKIGFIKLFSYCRKIAGTNGSIEKSIRSLGLKTNVLDDSSGEFFKVYIEGGISSEDREAVERIVVFLKRLRISYKVVPYQTLALRTSIGAYMKMTKIVRINDMALYKQVITNRGLAALADGIDENERRWEFSRFEYGTGKYVPEATATSLKEPAKVGDKIRGDGIADSKKFDRVEENGSRAVGVTLTAEILDDYQGDICEIGVYVKRGDVEILFALVSNPEGPLTIKIARDEVLFTFDLFLSNSDQNLVVTGSGDRLNLTFSDEYALLVARNESLLATIADLERRILKLEVST